MYNWVPVKLSLATRFVAELSKSTNRPSALITAFWEILFPLLVPVGSMLTRVVVCVCRSLT